MTGHQKQWEFLKRKLESSQLSHSYLFAGNAGLGKKDFSKEFSEFVGCKFPDLMVVEPVEGKEIPISKIREVQNFLAYKSYNGGFKVVVINEAEKMNQEAQSCFLKTLEEPKGKTMLILISSRPDMLLPTIFSRCQIVKFFGRPVVAPEKLNDQNKIIAELLGVINSNLSEKFKYAKSQDFDQNKLGKILEAMQKYFRYLLFLKTGIGGQKEHRVLPKAPQILQNYSVSKIKEDIKLMEDINSKLTFTNINPKLALEILLINI